MNLVLTISPDQAQVISKPELDRFNKAPEWMRREDTDLCYPFLLFWLSKGVLGRERIKHLRDEKVGCIQLSAVASISECTAKTAQKLGRLMGVGCKPVPEQLYP